jgi:hypothetical protein
MLEQGLVLIFLIGALWIALTTTDQRKIALGYLILLAAISTIISLLTGQGPNSHYGPY